MNRERINHLCESYLNDRASAEELQELEAAFHNPSLEEAVKAVLSEVYARFPKDSYADLDRKMANHIFDNISIRINEKASVRLWPRIAVAVAVALMIFGAGLFYVSRHSDETGNLTGVYQNDIAPGKAGATLTLANGKKIRLNDVGNGKLAKEAGVMITKTAGGQIIYEIASQAHNDGNNQFNTLSTANGETYQVRLPDGSKVWLNAASSLTYNVTLVERGVRKVKLAGEAYFEVSKDKNHPFIVQSNAQEVRVLGTHFNINAYADEPGIKTTLLEGSVRVSPSTGQAMTLRPGEQSSVDGDEIKVEEIDTELAVAWKNNQFIFESASIQYIMRMISRWYNVEVEYVGEIPTDGFGGAVSKFENVSEVLKPLEATGKVKFIIEGRRIKVMK